jgi:putative peptide zinc metalloprotease protein
LPNPDHAARRCARALARVPGALRHAARIGVICAVALGWLGMMAFHPLDDAVRLDAAAGIGVAVLALLWMSGHEFAHAVACRLYGFPLAGAGLIFRGFLLPSAYVNTSAIALSERRDVQYTVALAGPLFDLTFAATCALVALCVPRDGTPFLIAEYASITALLALYFNLTPFRASDGTSAFRALFAEGGAPDGWPRAHRGPWPHALVFHGLYSSAYVLLTLRLLAQLIEPFAS